VLSAASETIDDVVRLGAPAWHAQIAEDPVFDVPEGTAGAVGGPPGVVGGLLAIVNATVRVDCFPPPVAVSV
jgi:hypothetical protein